MKELKALLNHVTNPLVNGNASIGIKDLTFDSRQATSDVLFFAIVGAVNDGHAFINDAYKNGCRVAIVDRDVNVPSDMLIVKVADTSIALAEVSCAFFDNPSSKMNLVGIIGTNGKTTTATLLYQLFTALDFKVGLISTVVNKIGPLDIQATHTTPDPINLNRLLGEMSNYGCEYVFMEVSSHALHQNRTYGLHFSGGVFTNISHDHLDYHHSFAEYLKVKKSFFDVLSPNAFALTNTDDKNGFVMLQNSKAKKLTYSLTSIADFKGSILENELTGLVLKFNNREVYTQLIGKFNALNLLAVFGVSQVFGIAEIDALTAISQLKSVEGRFQHFKSEGGVTIVVDYAHTPDALDNVLKTIDSFLKDGSQLITIVGCGGNRDREKRPEMAKIAQKLSSQVILTSDNPRSENPSDILKEMMKGIDSESHIPVVSVEDRKQAIQMSAMLATKNDVVLIAGKGHEKYQEIDGVKFPFDDFEIAKGVFKQLKK